MSSESALGRILFMSTSKLPHWDLTPIFSTSKAYEEALSEVSGLCLKAKQQLEKHDRLADVIGTLNSIYSIYNTICSYAEANLSTETTNPLFIREQGQADELGLEVQEVGTLFNANIKSYQNEFSDPALGEYGYFLQHTLTESEHQMSIAEENLAADLMRSGSDAFERLYDTVSSTIGNGERTVIQLRGDATNPDRETRRKAYCDELKTWKQYEVSFAACLNSIKGTVLTLEKRRGWKSPLEESAFDSHISMEALEALISTLEKNLPVFRRYFAAKAKLMGIENLEWYDLFAPVGSSDKSYTYEEARDIVISSYTAFSEEMGKFAAKAFRENWIDAEPRKGKVGGAYDTSFHSAGVSRILANFDGSYDSVSTLAHELGHAYHDSVVMKQPAILADYPMTVAETASIFAETIVFRNVVAKADREEAILLMDQFVGSAAQVCVDILSRFYFERSAFERRREGELTPEDFCALMLDAQERTYGDALASKHEYMWAVKSHYYSTGFSFYNYPYAFGQLFALGLLARSEGEKDFALRYRELLSVTGKLSADDVAMKGGCDIKKESFWQEGIDIIETYVKRLEKSAGCN